MDALGWLANRSVKRIVLGLIVSTVVLLVVVPLLFLLWTSVWSGFPGQFSAHFTLENYGAVYFGSFFDIQKLLINSLTVGVVMTLTGGVLGLTFAWLLVRTNLPTKGKLEVVLLSGQAIPGYIYAFMYLSVYNTNNGVVSKSLRNAIGFGVPIDFATPWGAGFVIGVNVIPTFYLLIVPALQDLDPALEEASRISNGTVWTTLREITLPLIKPALISGAVVTFLYGLVEYSVVALLAGRGRFEVYSTRIHDVLRAQFPPAYGQAAALAVSLFLIMLVLVWYYRRVTERKEDYMTLTSQNRRSQRWDLRRWRWPITAVLWFVLFAVWVLPLLVLVVISIQASWDGTVDLSTVTLSHYVQVVTDPRINEAFINSLLVALGGATLGTVLAVGATYYTERTKARFRGLVDFLMMTPLAVPGIIMGSSLLFMFLWVGNVAPALSLYGTLGIIIVGCVMVFIPVSSRIAIGNIIQVHSELEEAARVAGASWLQQMRSVFLPLFRNTIIVIWFFLAIHIFQVLSIPAMTYTSDTVVIPIKLFQLYRSRPSIQLVSALSVILVGLTVLLIVVLHYAGVSFYELESRE